VQHFILFGTYQAVEKLAGTSKFVIPAKAGIQNAEQWR
jgi:hypothetical protein